MQRPDLRGRSQDQSAFSLDGRATVHRPGHRCREGEDGVDNAVLSSDHAPQLCCEGVESRREREEHQAHAAGG